MDFKLRHCHSKLETNTEKDALACSTRRCRPGKLRADWCKLRADWWEGLPATASQPVQHKQLADCCRNVATDSSCVCRQTNRKRRRGGSVSMVDFEWHSPAAWKHRVAGTLRRDGAQARTHPDCCRRRAFCTAVDTPPWWVPGRAPVLVCVTWRWSVTCTVSKCLILPASPRAGPPL